MTFRRLGFTLVELMIVIAIIGILASAIYPAASAYYARGRDVARISNVKELFLIFQNYARANSIYPSNVDSTGFINSYCISDILAWAPASTQKDKRFDQL